MTKAYRTVDADRLIPLLRSVQREIRERADAIRGLETKVRATPRQQRATSEFAALQAELANHRRELRLAREELERLGCVVDASDPRRILIPGTSGDLSDGFSWSFGDARVQSLVAGETV